MNSNLMNKIAFSGMLFAWVMLMISMIMSGCTLSFTNIDTHGKSEKVVDEDITDKADVKATANVKPWETP